MKTKVNVKIESVQKILNAAFVGNATVFANGVKTEVFGVIPFVDIINGNVVRFLEPLQDFLAVYKPSEN